MILMNYSTRNSFDVHANQINGARGHPPPGAKWANLNRGQWDIMRGPSTFRYDSAYQVALEYAGTFCPPAGKIDLAQDEWNL
uniref:Uncharacterized protein n=1 Tax=Kwoniella pini CBS 10737 TaxID=1296096 RepID=A0A1B9HSY0_9TREE|nr:uncharacterized protein I206_07610 [Kwoniella pini CBS 10737]OCF46376.1 hypothetical protein I206_07610 [Kwoniella pini CBS 10737]